MALDLFTFRVLSDNIINEKMWSIKNDHNGINGINGINGMDERQCCSKSI